MTQDTTITTTTTTVCIQQVFRSSSSPNGAWNCVSGPGSTRAVEASMLTPAQVVDQITSCVQHVVGLLSHDDELLISIQIRSQQEEDMQQYFLPEDRASSPTR